MSQSPTITQADFSSWRGLITNTGEHSVRPGDMLVQDNIQCLVPGSLYVRKGIQKHTTFTPSSPTSNDIYSLKVLVRQEGDCCITSDSAGNIKSTRAATATTLASSKSVYNPWSFERTRRGHLIGVNGIDRGIWWNGLASSAQSLGMDAATTAPTVAVAGSGGATAGTYICGYRWVDGDQPTGVPGNISEFATVQAATGDQFQWSLPGGAPTRASYVELWRSLSDDATELFFIARLSASTTSYTSDTYSDTALQEAGLSDPSTTMLVTEPNGQPNARRFTPPPTGKMAVSCFQDRMFYAADAIYTDGTVSVSSGGTSVTGSGTAWTSTMAGRFIYIRGLSGPIEISSVGSATGLTLATAANATVSGGSYAIRPTPEDRNAIYFSETDEPESVPETNIITVQENTEDDDEIVGLLPFGSILYVLKERHIYSLTFFAQPLLDADVRMLAHRGACNHRCRDILEGQAYLMDQVGCYRMSPGGGVEPISTDIDDLFRDGTIDFTKRKWFHVQADPAAMLVRFFVTYTSDSGTRPTRALVYNTRTGAWWTESYMDQIGDSGKTILNGRLRQLLGGQADVVFQTHEGTTDVVTSATRGTVTSATSTTLTDSTASFSAAMVGAPVAIISGTGKGQIRKIASRTSTQLTVAAWDTTPDTTSTYLIGAISWTCKTPLLPLPDISQNNERAAQLVFTPTTNAATFDVRRYINHQSTALNAAIGMNVGANMTQEQGSPDSVIDMQTARITGTQQAGTARVSFPGHMAGRGDSIRWVALELRGYQGADAIKIHSLQLDGIGGKE